jgi:CRP-like cAMP-binding protein
VGGPRDIKRRLKELAAALKAEPGSIPKRLELAAALREAGRPLDAIDLYRGVAEVYAEDGRLVQAMAVCKGILDIDPDHRDTLEMLATLAARREHGARRAPATLSHVGGRWVAEPSDRSALFEDEQTRSGEPRVRSLYDSDERPPPDPGESAPAAPDSHLTRAGTVEAERRRRQSSPTVERLRRDTDPAAPLDFSGDTKRRARGPRLIDLGARDDSDATGAPLESLSPRHDTDRITLLDTERMPMLSEEELLAAHAAEVARSLSTTRPPSGGISFGDEDSAVQLVNAVIEGPFPRPLLTRDPPPFPLLSDLPRAAFVELLARLSVVRLDAGETVLREGDAGDACYLIAAGRVRVTKANVEVAQLGPGSFFGEFAVLSDQRRHASVTTIDETELLEIRRDLIDELVAAHPGVARTLRTFYRERLLQTLLVTAPFFALLSPDERVAVAERFRPRRFGRGAQIIEEGAPGGGLYLILVGEVEVVRAGKEGKSIALGTLGEGSYFGEMSLLRGGVASATVRATRMTEAVQLPPRDFYEIASQHPVLWEQLRSEAERRELANHAIVAGEARKSDTFYLV